MIIIHHINQQHHYKIIMNKIHKKTITDNLYKCLNLGGILNKWPEKV